MLKKKKDPSVFINILRRFFVSHWLFSLKIRYRVGQVNKILDDLRVYCSDIFEGEPLREYSSVYVFSSRDPLFKERTIKEFCQELGSNSPAPGGGTASALSASLAQSLLLMVSKLSLTKSSHDFSDTIHELQEYEEVLLLLMDEDTEAFNQVMKAFKLPKEKEERTIKIQEAFAKAIEVPLKVMEIATQLLEYALILVRDGNKNALSDSGVGSLLAGTALKGARYNVLINLPYIKEDHKKREYIATMDRLYQRGLKALTEVEEAMEDGLSLKEE